MNLLLWVLRLLDGIMGIFRQLAGLDTVDGTDLVSLFLNNEGVTKVFFGILLISVVVAVIAMIVAIVKAFVNMSGGERKSISKITGQGIATVFISLFMAGIMISGITIANSLLCDVNAAFGFKDNAEFCNDLFEIAVGDDAYEMVPVYEYEQFYNSITMQYEDKLDANGKKIPVYLTDSEGNVMKDDSGNPIPKVKSYVREPIYQKNRNGDYILDANGKKIPVEGGWTDTGRTAKDTEGWSILNENADTILGQYSKDFPYVFPNPNKVSQEGLIYFGSFNFILGYVAAIIVLVSVISACLGLVKRLYDLVILFLSLPLIVSTIPLDDGARFKVWRETVVSKVVLAYGAVFAVNVFITMVPIITALHITKVMKMILIVGGGLSISGGMLLFARIFGTDAAESRDMAHSARTLLAGAAAGSKGIKTAKNFMFGVNDEKSAENRRLGVFGRLGRFLGNGSRANARLGLTGTGGTIGSTSGATTALTTQSQAGSQLGQALKTAGTQRYRDALTGRFISNTEAAKRGMTGSTGVKK
ncbi:MAG: hypothetical protein NC133_04160 [Prevotella sp.]|nr:hypothetical protein [Prevotella sp.]